MPEEFLYQSTYEQIDALAPAGRPLKDLVIEIRNLYLEDDRPWVIGFSGGKTRLRSYSLCIPLWFLYPPRNAQSVFS